MREQGERGNTSGVEVKATQASKLCHGQKEPR